MCNFGIPSNISSFLGEKQNLLINIEAIFSLVEFDGVIGVIDALEVEAEMRHSVILFLRRCAVLCRFFVPS